MKSCGTCKWWDHEGKTMAGRVNILVSDCNFPIPDLPASITDFMDTKEKESMFVDDGVNCQTYEAKL